MTTTERINKQAKEAYDKCFKDITAKPTPKNEDVVLNKEKLSEDVNEMKIAEEKKHQSLEVLREKIDREAKESLQNTFGAEKSVEPKKKMSTSEMYDELQKEKEHLAEMATQLKNKELKK